MTSIQNTQNDSSNSMESYLESIIYYKDSQQHNSIIYTIEANRFKKGIHYDSVIEYARASLDESLIKSKEKYNKNTIITHLDLKGVTMKQIDTGFFKQLVVMLQTEYEDILEKLIVTNIPVFFKIVYKIIRPFLDKDTKKKIFFEKKNKKGSREFTNNDDILEDI